MAIAIFDLNILTTPLEKHYYATAKSGLQEVIYKSTDADANSLFFDHFTFLLVSG
ncbi:hypothetical protein [Legionella septentrionalis]|uniref:hypothetical protein n=1 Tax=Legionella septentrionalis TaxID=2498109 RepID=UPI00131529D4|nr:hypothetical protein [Legionella septentrionalis]